MGSVTSRECPEPGNCEGGETCRDTRITRSKLILLTRAVNKFSINLFQEFSKEGKKAGNIIVSPLSVSLGLGLVLLGAVGKTREELWRGLYLHEVVNNHDLMAAYAAMHWDSLLSTVPKGCIVEMAVRLFAPKGVAMTHDYEEVCAQFEITKMHNVDFAQSVDSALQEINEWAQQRTHGLVQDALLDSLLNSDTKLFMLCVTHIKVRWRKPFAANKTVKVPFQLGGKDLLQVNMMRQKTEFMYASCDSLDCSLLELPFENQYSRMYIFLPRKPDGLARLEKALKRAQLEAAIDSMDEEVVDLWLPRFQFSASVSLNERLQKLGIKDMFSASRADLSFLSASPRLHVSNLWQHVHIEYEENESCSPSSSTHVTHLPVPSRLTSVDPQHVKTFKVDHPFLFVIRDVRTGSIWVIGRVIRPSAL